MFPSISPKQSFPALESEILAYWKANKTFEKSVSSRPEDNPYRFYDGPPFITGTPHYGNLLSSIVKDVVGRYWTMRGKRVDRIWGWDCHGLPIEEKVQKKLGLASNKEIEERGVKEFIDGCYEYTASTSAEWTWYIDKIGRWVDMDRAYRTMDQDYMESVMWVFRQLWDKGLIYEGKRVSLYSWKLGTPISNFEVAMDDTYQEVNDPAVTVKFKLEKNSIFPEGTSVLAWTTTPWTIVANMALAVRKDIEYVVIENNGEKLIVAKNRLETVFKGKGDYTIVQELKGSELVGLSYIPPFPEYYNKKHGEKNHKIYHADFITDTDGTGIGHEAPEFGDVDFQLAKREGIFISEAMDEAGKYTSQIFDYEGTHYQDANKINIERMKENGTLFKHESISHRVPFCPRSGTPLVQKAQASWFIDIQSQKEKLLEANKQINWFPEHLKYGRFAKGIESAPDWCISRTRYWGAPMPVWQSKNGSERVVVSSREEIFEMNKPYGQLEKREVEGKIKYFFKGGEFDGIEFNLHKPYIDSILLAPKSAQTARKVLGVHGFRRTENVVDFFAQTTKNLEDQGIQVTCPLFEEGETVNYETWKKTFLENIDGVDTIFAHSLGCRLSLDMIIKYQIPLKKLILIAPPEGKHERLQEFLGELQEDISKINKFVEEVVILYSVDDKEGRVVASKELVEKTNGHSIRLSGFGHFNITENKLIEGLILHGAPLVRIPEVLDVWMDSGSMPYAQVHFPFAGFEDTSIKKAQTEDEKTANFAFFEKMWEEEFDMDFQNRPNTSYEWIREDFWKSNVYYVSEGSTITSAIQISTQIKDNVYVPVGSSVLGRIGTLVEHRGKGNGTKLIKKALSDLSKKGVKEVYLNAEIKNIEFYKSFGFIQIQEIPEDKGNTSALYMKKTLSKIDELQSLTFPADFIAEYVGQVRAWFYVMHVLGVLLNPNDKKEPTPSFTNVITTGVINGNDGRKMSKSYGNYPDPRVTIEKYGADPIRFYMLNSPLLSGGDMDFKEEQIIETVKGVMLPLWNTYSFFTTYANIDKWEKDETEIWFTRHGESTSNVATTMSDGTDNPELTEKGREQSKDAGKKLKEEGKHFDIIIHTSKVRAQDTAKIIGNSLGFNGEYIIDDRFIEQAAGEYARMTHDSMRVAFAKENNLNPTEVTDFQIRTMYKNNSLENIEKFEKRILSGYESILNTYKGKKILIVGHAGTSRPILNHYFGKGLECAHYETKIGNAEPYRLMITPLVNPLDSWILSKLQVLLGQVHDAMDAYDVSRACRAIVDYMDHLTNWYVRLSRRRFWESGMTPDKASAYETLHTVLVEVSKLIAPFMPFIAESVFQGLTKKESVHLEYVTFPQRLLISNELNHDMERCENIVSLGLALRSRKNIRVRQPLASVTITEELSEYYEKIIKDELNVKEIRRVDPTSLAKKIAKPDAKKIGPKYGKSVQEIITKAKNGEFEEVELGIKVGEFLLENGEYTMEYLPLQEGADVEGGHGMVISLDTGITRELKLEGYARDIVRLIQDMRKEAAYNVTDRINISITGDDSVKNIITHFGNMIAEETLGTIAESLPDADVSKEESLDENITVKLSVKTV